MRFIFKYQIVNVPAQSCFSFGLSQTGVREVPICTGGSFVPMDNENDNIELTDEQVLLRNKDWTAACCDWVKSFIGGGKSYDTGYIGKWSEDVDKNAKIYYFVNDGIIHKMFFTRYAELGMSNVLNIVNVIQLDGKMMDCTPDEGDIIYSTYKEAEKALNKIKKSKQ